jgi:antitoxin (DNA-binding transcriptional repressor) of toxin-antitoxin stability system
MPRTLPLATAQPKLSELIASMVPGEELALTANGEPVDIVTRPSRTSWPSQPGKAKGRSFWMAPDFDAPLEDMEQIKALLTESEDQIRSLLGFCDSWNLAEFRSQHLADLRRFPRLQFLFLARGLSGSRPGPAGHGPGFGRVNERILQFEYNCPGKIWPRRISQCLFRSP